jgi:DNA-binding protein H-NS
MNDLIAEKQRLADEMARVTAEIEAAKAADFQRSLALVRETMESHGITLADLTPKAAPKTPRKASTKTSKPTPGVTYDIGGVIYTTGKSGKPPAAYLRAKLAGTLDQYEVAA